MFNISKGEYQKIVRHNTSFSQGEPLQDRQGIDMVSAWSRQRIGLSGSTYQSMTAAGHEKAA